MNYKTTITAPGEPQPIIEIVKSQSKALLSLVRVLVKRGVHPEELSSCFPDRGPTNSSKPVFHRFEGELAPEEVRIAHKPFSRDSDKDARLFWENPFYVGGKTYVLSRDGADFCERLNPLIEKYRTFRILCQKNPVARHSFLPLNVEVRSALNEVQDLEDQLEFSDEGRRKRNFQAIVVRGGGARFRMEMLLAFGKCVVTGTDCEEALQAAHINGYRGDYSDTVDNGILLRADLHLLFDRGLLAFACEKDGVTVIIHPSILGTSYGHLNGNEVTSLSDIADKRRLHRLREHRLRCGL